MIKKTNPAISKKLLSVKGGIHDLLMALGYIEVNFLNNKGSLRWIKNITPLLEIISWSY